MFLHIHPQNNTSKWHSLIEHLLQTARRAEIFAASFSMGNTGFVLGALHDLGKINPEFQLYLQDCNEKRKGKSVPHSICSAALLRQLLMRINDSDLELAICIHGHHGGLGEAGLIVTENGILDRWWHDPQNKNLKKMMYESLSCLDICTPEPLPKDIFRREFSLRMLFSSLVDADFLDTEKHFAAKQARLRDNWVRPADLWPVFRSNQLQMMWRNRWRKLNKIRRRIYNLCLKAGRNKPGMFRLTVPTGGGKTRSAMAFALSHAVNNRTHGFWRIIIAVPYTSIIDQNAQVYRDIFGDNFVLEHHSQVEANESGKQDEKFLRHRLAAENWDYPIIVTTTVQLFESLFANKPSKCRKLHNIAKSIIILDEVQTLPIELLSPTMDVIKTLVDDYGVSVVFSTATQPAFDNTPYLKEFNDQGIKEIVPEPDIYFEKLKRVTYEPVRKYESLEDLALELAEIEKDQVLVVFNTRKQALELHRKLRHYGVEGLYHLSTLLCGAHRKRVLREVFEGLEEGKPVRLISTQVVEAGVDLDFPVVYRAIGPLDRIVQAAGRCNREGRRETGQVFIFDFPENRTPPGPYRSGLDVSKIILKRNNPQRLHHPEIFTEYFQSLFRDCKEYLDKNNIQGYRSDLNFPAVAEKYRMIEPTVPVVITSYNENEGERRLGEYLENPSRFTWRRLLPYVINMSSWDLQKDEIRECLMEVEEGNPYLFRWVGGYDDKTHQGILGMVRDPADLIIGE